MSLFDLRYLWACLLDVLTGHDDEYLRDRRGT